MRNNKKSILVTILVLVLSAPTLFAASSWGNIHGTGTSWGVDGLTNKIPTLTSPRLKGLGNTGTALSTGVDALYTNPANLAAHRGFTLNIPFLNIEILGATNVLSKTGFNFEIPGLINAALDLITKGNNPLLLNIDGGVGFTVGGFGLNAFVNLGLYAYTPDLIGNSQIFPVATAGFSVGYGHRVLDTKLHKVDFGVAVSFMMRAYTEPYTFNEISSLFAGNPSTDEILNILLPTSRKAMVGFMHPISVGVSYRFANWLSASVALNNIFPSATGYKHFTDLMTGIKGVTKNENLGQIKMGVFDTASLDVAVGFNPKWKWFNPRIEIGLVDLIHYTQAQKSDARKLLAAHTRVGLEIFLVEFLAVRAGIDAGRVSFGARLDLFPLVVDLTYGWREWGENVGDKPIDYVALTFKLGWDRTK